MFKSMKPKGGSKLNPAKPSGKKFMNKGGKSFTKGKTRAGY